MSVLSQQNTESTVIAENTDISFNWDTGNKAQWRITASALQNIRSLPRMSMKKVLTVRQQLTENRYDFDKRLDAVLDRLLKELVA